ncbi:MAG: hypothetical protein ACO2ZP_09775 [Bacteriovoracaceae bacterium]
MNVQRLTLDLSISLFMGFTLILMGSEDSGPTNIKDKNSALIQEYLKTRTSK